MGTEADPRLTYGGWVPVWCDVCEAASAVIVDIYRLESDGPVLVGTYEGCPICDGGNNHGRKEF